jgi:hypothetical protein
MILSSDSTFVASRVLLSRIADVERVFKDLTKLGERRLRGEHHTVSLGVLSQKKRTIFRCFHGPAGRGGGCPR